MRISDWSSDVCSSDLQVEVGDQVITLGRGDLILVSVVQKTAYDTVRVRDGVDINVRAVDMEPTHQCKALTRAGVCAILWTRQPDVLSTRSRFKIGAWLIPLNDDTATALMAEAVAGRSEEHTSELQSLMRISYAVFCLTKKK